MSGAKELCLTLGPVPLKADEEHCAPCDGRGYFPIPKPKHNNITLFEPPQCTCCQGVGKFKIRRNSL